MNKNLLWKVVFIVGTMLFFLFGIFGIPKGLSGDALATALTDHIHLGLDLKGGTHLILQVHVNDAINVDAQNAIEVLKQAAQAFPKSKFVGIDFHAKSIETARQRAAEGEIPGALILERNHLEWRLDPSSATRVPAAVPGQRWILACWEGYTSSLAASVLRSIGIDATDLAGGVRRWRAAGLPTQPGPTRVGQVVGEQPSVDTGDLAGPHVIDEAAH